MMRLIAGSIILVACICAAVVAYAPVFSSTPNGVVAAVLLVIGFIALDVTRTPTAPLRPLRMAVGIGLVIALAMTVGVAMSATAADLATIALNGAIVLASVAVHFTITRRPALAVALLTALALNGAFFLYRTLVRVALPTNPGPAEGLAYVVAASSSAAFIAALWHARALPQVRSAPKRTS